MEGEGPGDGIVASGKGEAGPKPYAGRVGVVSLLQRTLDVFLARWPLFMVLAVPSTLGGLAFWRFVTAPSSGSIQGLTNLIEFCGLMVVLYPAMVLGSLAICAAADDLQSGGRATTRTVLARGGRRFASGLIGLVVLLIAFVVVGQVIVVAPMTWLIRELSLTDRISDLLYGAVVPLLAVPWSFVWWRGAARIAAGRITEPHQASRLRRLVGDRRTAAAFLLFSLLAVPAAIGVVWMLRLPNGMPLLAGAVILNVAVTPLVPIALTIARRDATPAAVSWNPRLPIIYLAVVLMASLAVLGPVARSVGATAADVFASVPAEERGALFAGTDWNPFNACRPLHRQHDFLTFQRIFFGGYYARPLAPGETATLRTYESGHLVATEPISPNEQPADCYGVELVLYSLDAGKLDYTYTVRVGIEDLAEGGFTIRDR